MNSQLTTKSSLAWILAAIEFRTIFRWVIGGVFILAAISKAWEPTELWRLLIAIAPSWRWTHGALVGSTVSLCAWEAFLGGVFLLSRPRRLGLFAAGITLLAFTIVLGSTAMGRSLPRCGCLGSLRMASDPVMAAWLGIARNLGLMWMLAVLWPRGSSGEDPRRRETAQSQASRGRAFTILEMLVVIAVIAVLLAIILPSLRTARSSAVAVVGSSNLRQLAASVVMYGGDWHGSFPSVATPGTPFVEIDIKGWRENGYQRPYFSASVRFWPSVVLPAYGEIIPGLTRWDGEDPASATFRYSGPTPASGANPVVWSNAWLTHTADAQSRYWDEDVPPEDLSLLRAVRMDDVASPSLKGMLLDVTAGAYSKSNELEGRRRIAVALCDGSAGWRPWLVHEAGERAGVALGGVERTGLGAVPWPIMTTRHGVAGRDFESGGGPAESPKNN